MKKLVLALSAAAALALTGCGAGNYDGYSTNGGYSDWDWDMNNPSVYNNNTYCSGGIYNPQPNGMYSCTRNGVTSTPSKRPTPVIPPKNQQKAPAKPAAPAAPKQNNPAPKQQSQPKAPSAPKAPAPKSGK